MTTIPSGAGRPRLEGGVPARSSQQVSRTDEPVSAPSPAPAVASRDVLDLSPAARALVARSGEAQQLPAERLMEIRQRVLDGHYDSPAVIDAVAQRLRQSGDLR